MPVLDGVLARLMGDLAEIVCYFGQRRGPPPSAYLPNISIIPMAASTSL